MQAGLLAALAVMGLASGAHCVGMCGGIVTAFNVVEFRARSSFWRRQLLFNAGRISTYAAAGTLAGALGYAAGATGAQSGLHVLASVALILVGLHLAGFGALLRLERLGAPLWRRLQPLAARASATGNSYFAGLLWGWLLAVFDRTLWLSRWKPIVLIIVLGLQVSMFRTFRDPDYNLFYPLLIGVVALWAVNLMIPKSYPAR